MTKKTKSKREPLKAPKPLHVIKKVIKEASKTFKVKPCDLNKVQFWDYASRNAAHVKEWDVRKLGGFDALRDQMFPKDPEDEKPQNPLSTDEASRLEGHALSDYIAAVIKECSTSIGIPAHELTWYEFRRYAKVQWGEDDEGIGRYNITRAGGFNAIRDAYFPITPTENVVDKKRLMEHVNLNRRLGKAYAEKQFFLENIESLAERCFKGKVEAVTTPKRAKKIERTVNVILSDLHIGSDLSREETGYQSFGKVEEARRMASLVKQICSYKEQYRSESKLVVHLIGDIIQGQLHDARDGAVQAEQFARAVHLLSQAVAHFSSAFPEVDIWCATGNHGRNTARHFNRAIHQKWDSIETEIYVALMYACSNLKNVKFHIPKTPYCKVPVFGHKIFTTHGDTVLKPGYPGKAINIGSLDQQINKINASLPDAEEYAVFAVGHVHTASVTFLDNGKVMFTNGCMVPVDQFAVSIGVMESQCGQWIWESTAKHPVGDQRLIKVGKSDDENAELDKVIKPWERLPE